MSRYTAETRVLVRSHSRQADGDDIIVGREGVFLALPRYAVELLDLLAAQNTVGETQTLYRQTYNETPDLEVFLQQMEQSGFLCPLDGSQDQQAPPGASVPKRYHFETFP